MKGWVETTIPQRQYENIKTHYEFETEEERQLAIDRAAKDCISLNGIVEDSIAINTTKEENRTAFENAPNKALGVTEEWEFKGVQFRNRKGIVEYWSAEQGVWKKGKAGEIIEVGKNVSKKGNSA